MRRFSFFFLSILCLLSLVFNVSASSLDTFSSNHFSAYITHSVAGDYNEEYDPVMVVPDDQFNSSHRWYGFFHHYVPGRKDAYISFITEYDDSHPVEIIGWDLISAQFIDHGNQTIQYIFRSPDEFLDFSTNFTLVSWHGGYFGECWLESKFYEAINPSFTNVSLTRFFKESNLSDAPILSSSFNVDSAWNTTGGIQPASSYIDNDFMFYQLAFDIPTSNSGTPLDLVSFSVLSSCRFDIVSDVSYKLVDNIIYIDTSNYHDETIHFAINYYPDFTVQYLNSTSVRYSYDAFTYGIKNIFALYPSSSAYDDSSIGQIISGKLDLFLKRVTNRFDNLTSGLTSLSSSIGTWFQDQYTLISSVGSDVGTWFQNQYSLISSVGSDINSNLVSIGNYIISRFSTLFTVLDNFRTAVVNNFTSLYNMIADRFSTLFDLFGNLINGTSSQQSAADEFDSSSSQQSSDANSALSGLDQAPTLDPGSIDLNPNIDSSGTNVLRLFITPILSNSIIFQIIFISLTFALGSYIIFGKR